MMMLLCFPTWKIKPIETTKKIQTPFLEDFGGKHFLISSLAGAQSQIFPAPPPHLLTFTWWRLTRRSFYRRLKRPSQATATDLSSADLNSDTR